MKIFCRLVLFVRHFYQNISTKFIKKYCLDTFQNSFIILCTSRSNYEGNNPRPVIPKKYGNSPQQLQGRTLPTLYSNIIAHLPTPDCSTYMVYIFSMYKSEVLYYLSILEMSQNIRLTYIYPNK